MINLAAMADQLEAIATIHRKYGDGEIWWSRLSAFEMASVLRAGLKPVSQPSIHLNVPSPQPSQALSQPAQETQTAAPLPKEL